MAKLIYAALASLDGYVADEHGAFDWAAPDDEVHAFVNDLTRPIGTRLYGRRLYEVMVAWETLDTAGEPPAMRDFAEIWRAADKVVYSRTLESVAGARTRIERAFDPEAVRGLKAAADRDLTIGGPELAAHVFRAGLVDECHLFLAPSSVPARRRSPRASGSSSSCRDERRFAGGMVHLAYATAAQPSSSARKNGA